LPFVMGLDVLKWIRQESGLELVVLLLTASAEQADIAAAYRLGVNGFLVKPSEATKLADMARAIRDFWLTHNVLPHTPCPRHLAAAAGAKVSQPRSKRLFGRNGSPRKDPASSVIE
jgi:CheY-like chemotaxis protein